MGSGYTETYTAADGSQVIEPLPRQVGASWPLTASGVGGGGPRIGPRSPHALLLQDHCFYQGHVEGQEHSAASLSTCVGLRWVLGPSRGIRASGPWRHPPHFAEK